MAEYHFTHRRRSYRLTKRSDVPGASWQFDHCHAGKRVRKSLGTAHIALARDKARALIDARERGDLEALRILKVRSDLPSCTVEEYADFLLDLESTAVKAETLRGYSYALRQVMRHTEASASAPLSRLEPACVRRWLADADAAAARQQRAGDLDGAGRTLRSALSTLRQAMAAVNPGLLTAAADAGLKVPDLSAAVTEFRARKKALSTQAVKIWTPPAPEAIARLLGCWMQNL